MENEENVFERLLTECRGAVERFVYYKMPTKADGDDILQNCYLIAFVKFAELKDKSRFLAWMLTIARNQCNDFYRTRARTPEILTEEGLEWGLGENKQDDEIRQNVSEVLETLSDNDKRMLDLFYVKNLPQRDIAQQLNIPLGTVKSRLHAARHKFKIVYTAQFSYPPTRLETYAAKEDETMQNDILPMSMPDVKITPSAEPPFAVTWEETLGWFIVPKLDATCDWAIYDYPSKKRAEGASMAVVGRAAVHGIEGVEILAKETSPESNKAGKARNFTVCTDRVFVAQLTETHTRFLAESHYENGIKQYRTFLDADEFMPNWGIGEDNCGNEIHVKQKGLIKRNGNDFTCPTQKNLIDVVGRYTVSLNGRDYDTLLVMDVDFYENKIVCMHYLDQNGRTVLWRRYNHEEWAIHRYKQRWSEKLPDNERITVNGDLYVHWYDCLTDYAMNEIK